MRLFLAELVKLRTVPRTVIGLLIGELALVAIGTVATIDNALSPHGLASTLEQDLIGVAATAMLFALILGILVITWEYRHGTITQTFLATPKRERVVATKALAAALGGLGLAIPSVLLMLVIAEIWVGGRSDFHFGGHEFTLVARLLLGSALVAVIGLEIGAAIASQLAAILTVFVWLIFGEHLLGALWGAGKNYLPFRALSGVLGTDGGTLSLGPALLVLGAYGLVFGTIAVIITHHRDIT
jgi:hypothetical protein